MGGDTHVVPEALLPQEAPSWGLRSPFPNGPGARHLVPVTRTPKGSGPQGASCSFKMKSFENQTDPGRRRTPRDDVGVLGALGALARPRVLITRTPPV